MLCKCKQLMQSGMMLKKSKLSWINMFHNKTDDFVIDNFFSKPFDTEHSSEMGL